MKYKILTLLGFSVIISSIYGITESQAKKLVKTAYQGGKNDRNLNSLCTSLQKYEKPIATLDNSKVGSAFKDVYGQTVSQACTRLRTATPTPRPRPITPTTTTPTPRPRPTTPTTTTPTPRPRPRPTISTVDDSLPLLDAEGKKGWEKWVTEEVEAGESIAGLDLGNRGLNQADVAYLEGFAAGEIAKQTSPRVPPRDYSTGDDDNLLSPEFMEGWQTWITGELTRGESIIDINTYLDNQSFNARDLRELKQFAQNEMNRIDGLATGAGSTGATTGDDNTSGTTASGNIPEAPPIQGYLDWLEAQGGRPNPTNGGSATGTGSTGTTATGAGSTGGTTANGSNATGNARPQMPGSLLGDIQGHGGIGRLKPVQQPAANPGAGTTVGTIANAGAAHAEPLNRIELQKIKADMEDIKNSAPSLPSFAAMLQEIIGARILTPEDMENLQKYYDDHIDDTTGWS